MEEFQYQIKVPRDRIAVLIGEEGKMKRELQQDLGVKLEIDSEDGDVTLSGKDSIKLYTAQEIVKAIARGFNPEIAKRLLKTEYTFELLNLSDYAKTKNHIMRLKGRIIGEKGKAWKTIEELTETSLTVYGKTIGLIGEAGNVSTAKRGIDMLLTGAPHSTVFRILERWRRDQHYKDLEQHESTPVPEEALDDA